MPLAKEMGQGAAAASQRGNKVGSLRDGWGGAEAEARAGALPIGLCKTCQPQESWLGVDKGAGG